MSDFKSISDRIADGRPAPGKIGHRHPGCGHGCACYSPKTFDCQSCRTTAANARMDADYRARLAQHKSD